MKQLACQLLALLLIVCVGVAAAGTFQEDVTFTDKEKKALDRFKPLVISKIPPGSQLQKWKADDLYLMTWLRANNLDVREAERKFLGHLKWREENKMDTIFDEDWTEWNREYRIYSDGFDKEGRPIGEMWLGNWQVREGVLAGNMKKLHRWGGYMWEQQARRLWEGRAAGQNISQAILLVELEDFNLIQQGCPTCLPLWAAMAVQLEHHYPNLMESIYLINIPSSFDIVLKIALPVMRPVTRKSIKSYPDKGVWQPLLDSKIDKAQRSIRLGGTKERDA